MTKWHSPESVTFPGVASPADCCAQCSRNTSCTAWTYYVKPPTSYCQLAPFATISYGPNLTSGSTTPPTWQPPEPPPPLPTTGECQYVQGTVYNEPVAHDNWQKQIDTSSAGQCCAICRTLPECLVSNYVPTPWLGDVQGACTMRGKVNLSHPTHVPNATACIVKTRPPPPQPTPPGAMNVLYIVSDDARPEMPSYGQDYVKAPNLAALSARGLTFMNAYCQQSICSPSRNSFMSGKRPQNTRTWNFINDFRQEFPFLLSFPQYFKRHNYSTTGLGKLYHPGHPVNFDEPLSWSQNASSPDDPIAPYPPYQRDSGKSKGCGYFDVCPTGTDPKRGGRDQFVDHHTATEAMGTMDLAAKAERPFFIGVGLIRPHLPFIVPEDTWAQYNHSAIKLPASLYPPVNVANVSLNDQVFQGTHSFCPDGTDIATDCPSVERRTLPTDTGISPFKPFDADNIRFLRHGYYAAVTFMDEQVGRLLDHLEQLGKTQSTIVVFHGDHGWHLGEQGLWTKKTCFELGARVPLIIAAPHLKASHGKRTSQMAELVDIYPTVAELAGLPSPPDMDGASLMPAFLDPTALAGAKDYAFSEFPQCPSDPEISLWHTEFGCQGVPREKIGFFGFSIRSAAFRYTEWHPWSPQLKADWSTMTGVELYDYRDVDMTDFDQFDRVNVADAPEHAAAQAELAVALRSHYSRMVL
jgi:iduronate 2-sulfatase